MNDFWQNIDVHRPLSRAEMERIMSAIMDGKVNDSALENLLLTLAERGETPDEITGAAQILRDKVTPINAPNDAIDCCGTGGDGSGTYNISTAVALVSAACGVPVAKHGNRAASSKSGTADVLEALGINLNVSPKRLEHALRKYNFAFLMAGNHHTAMKHVRDIRKKIGKRTIFNLLGPLANPAGTRRQLIGVFDQKWVRPIAESLKQLGSERAWVVHGADGLDEITLTDKTYLTALHPDGKIEEKTLTPEDFGLPYHAPKDLKGGNASENADALLALLNGKAGAYRDIVLANTAAVLCIHSSETDLKKAVQTAATTIDNGLALQTLNNYIHFSQQSEAT